MIKKLVHYVWFSNDEMPETVKKCIESWHKYLPDYEFKRWGMKEVDGIDSFFLKEALSVKKWAFATDYVRLWAVYNEGGIYMDTDVELKGSFDPFLKDSIFIGKERFYQLSYTFKNPGLCRYLTAHCFGGEAGHNYLKRCLDYYNEKHFIVSSNLDLPESLRYDHTPIPFVMANIAYADGYNWNPKAQIIQHLKGGLTIYPTEYFDGQENQKRCIAIHHALGSWTIGEKNRGFSYKMRFVNKLKSLVGRFFYGLDIAIFKLRH